MKLRAIEIGFHNRKYPAELYYITTQ